MTVFFYYSKAFDTVNHAILLNKLQKYGIRRLPFQLIMSNFLDRIQIVKNNDSLSSSQIINIGVLQGSILGPLLFLLMIFLFSLVTFLRPLFLMILPFYTGIETSTPILYLAKTNLTNSKPIDKLRENFWLTCFQIKLFQSVYVFLGKPVLEIRQ